MKKPSQHWKLAGITFFPPEEDQVSLGESFRNCQKQKSPGGKPPLD